LFHFKIIFYKELVNKLAGDFVKIHPARIRKYLGTEKSKSKVFDNSFLAVFVIGMFFEIDVTDNPVYCPRGLGQALSRVCKRIP